MQTKFASIQEIISSRINAIFEKLNERKSHRTTFEFDGEGFEEEVADVYSVPTNAEKSAFGLTAAL